MDSNANKKSSKLQQFKRICSLLLAVITIFSSVQFDISSFNTAIAQTNPNGIITFCYDDFTNSSLLKLNGAGQTINDANTDGKKALRLTPTGKDIAGSAFYKNNVSLVNNRSFSTYFSFKITGIGGSYNMSNNRQGADGFVFILANDINSLGSGSLGIGYTGIKPSVGIEFDTWNNDADIPGRYGEETGDPSSCGVNHIAINTGGETRNPIVVAGNNNTKVAPGATADVKRLPYDIKDGNTYYAWIDYDGSKKELTVKINNTNNLATSTKVISTTSVDLNTTLNTNEIYAGFTAGTGWSWENHDIKSWYFNNDYTPIDTRTTNYSAAPSSITVTADPSSNALTSTITATAKNYDGSPASNVPVRFSTTMGSLSSTNVNTDSNGKATVTYTNSGSGTATIKVVAAGGAYASTTVTGPTAAQLSNEAISGAKGLLPGSFTAIEGTHTNLLTYINGISGMSEKGVTISLVSTNSNIASDGAITYGSAEVTGNVEIKINKAGGTEQTKTIAVTVPAHIKTAAELSNEAISGAKGLLPGSFTAIEGTHTNLLTYINGISGMSEKGVTISLVSSNSNIASDGAITYGSAEVTGNVEIKINKADGTEQTKTIPVTVPAHIKTAAELSNEAISGAKGLLPGSFTAIEGTHTNLLTYINGISGMSEKGVTISLVSSNSNIASDGAITYGSAEVTGNVEIKINKADGTEQTKTIPVTVPAHIKTAAELSNEAISGAKGLLPGSFTAIEGTHTNLLTYINGISGMSEKGVTISLVSSNSNIASDGAITYGSAEVTGNVEIKINKADGTEQTKTIPVTVPAHIKTAAELSNEAISGAKGLLPGSFTAIEGTHTNLLTYINGISGMSEKGVTISLVSSNSNIASDGAITYGSAEVTGNVEIKINKADGTEQTKTIPVTVPAHIKTAAELSNEAINGAKGLLPGSFTAIEGTHTNLLTYINGISGMSEKGVTISLVSTNSNIASDGAITYGSAEVTGNVEIKINKADGTEQTKTIPVTVPAHIKTAAELSNEAISGAKGLLPGSFTAIEGTHTNLLTYINGISGMSEKGVTISLVSTNSNIASDGAITYGSAEVTGNVEIKINKADGTEQTKTIPVTVPAHIKTAAELSNEAISGAKGLLPGSFTAIEGTHTNLLTYINGISGMSEKGVTISLVSSNSNIASDGAITYGSAEVTGNVEIKINKADGTEQTKTIPVTVPAHIKTAAELSNEAISGAKGLLPGSFTAIEGTHTNLLTYINGISGMSEKGVTISLVSTNSNIASDGAITYGSAEVTGNVEIKINKADGTEQTKTIPVTVPAHIKTAAELSNEAINGAKGLLPGSFTAIEGTHTNLLTYINGISGMSEKGVTISLVSSNSNIASDGAITYGSAEVTGNVEIKINKADGTEQTKTIPVTVPAHIKTAAELSNEAISGAKGLLPGSFTAIEGTHTNLLTYINGISGMSEKGVTISLVSSNSNIASDGAITYGSAEVTGNVEIKINKADGTEQTKTIPVTVPAHIKTAAELSNEAISGAKGLLPGSFTAIEGTHTNLLTYINGISGMSEKGVTISLVSTNSNIASDGAITYGSAEVTGNVEIKINKAGGTEQTKTIAVTVPAHIKTAAELSNEAISGAKGLLPGSFTAIEGTHTNLLTYINGISGMSEKGVTISLVSSNSNIASDGAITYGSAEVTGNVEIKINKADGTEQTKTIPVTVPAHIKTAAELSNEAISGAKGLLPGSFTAIEGTHTNLLTYINGISGMSEKGVTISLVSSNSNIASDGAITYGSAEVTGNVEIKINKADGTEQTKTIPVTVPAHIKTAAELSNEAISGAKGLLPGSFTAIEGTHTNLLTYINGISGMSEKGVTISLVSSNSNIASDGAITYGSAEVTGNVEIKINKADGTEQTKTIPVTVPAHIKTAAELSNEAISGAKGLLPGSFTAIEGTHTNLLTYINGISGMSEKGVTISLVSSNSNIASDGAITYGSAEVTGNVEIKINKADGTEQTKTIAVTVPAHTKIASELSNEAINGAKALLPGNFTAIEGTHTNLLTYINGISGMSEKGVTISLVSSNSNIAANGAITYGSAEVTGNVEIKINKAGGTEQTKTIAVTVPAHTKIAAELSNEAISGAKGLLPGNFTAIEGTHTNLLTYINGISGMSEKGVTISLVSSNSNIAANGAITYGSAEVTGNVEIKINKAGGTEQTKTIAVTVPAKIITNKGGNSSSSSSSYTPAGTSVIVDGKNENIGKEIIDGKTISIVVDQNKLSSNIASASNGSSVIIPVSSDASAAASLVVANVEDMASKNMTLTVHGGNIAYNLNTSAIDIKNIAESFSGVDTKNILFNVSMSNSLKKVDGARVIVNPVEFVVTADYGGKKVSVDTFTKFVDRTIEITEEQAKQITTAVVVEEDGSLRHVPTNVITTNGKNYAVINSLTNSTYALINNDVKFIDANGKWYESFVNEMASRKIINGIGDGKFEGDKAITRGEFAKIIIKALGLPAKGTSSFSDVAKDAWYSEAIATAVQYNIVSGVGDNKFNPESNITREEAMQMIYAASKLTQIPKLPDTHNLKEEFSDYGTQSSWSEKAVDFNINNELIVGSNGTFRPSGTITRAEVATVVLRLLQRAKLIDTRSKI